MVKLFVPVTRIPPPVILQLQLSAKIILTFPVMVSIPEKEAGEPLNTYQPVVKVREPPVVSTLAAGMGSDNVLPSAAMYEYGVCALAVIAANMQHTSNAHTQRLVRSLRESLLKSKNISFIL